MEALYLVYYAAYGVKSRSYVGCRDRYQEDILRYAQEADAVYYRHSGDVEFFHRPLLYLLQALDSLFAVLEVKPRPPGNWRTVPE